MLPTNLGSQLMMRPMLCDGAMGTQLFARGLAPGESGERWNLDRPAEIEAIHRAYRDAGCDLVTTNTFGATRSALKRHELENAVTQINRLGAQLARRGAGAKAVVLGDVGPLGEMLDPVGDLPVSEAREMFIEQIEAMAEGGADAIVIETMSDPVEMVAAIEAAKKVGKLPVVATYAFARTESRGFRTMMGTTVFEAMEAAIDAGADVVGANCGTSLKLEDYCTLAEELVAAAGRVPVIVQPNAGSPSSVNGQLSYPATPADMGRLTESLLDAGVRIIGGCCGTTPDHLKAMAGRVLRQK